MNDRHWGPVIAADWQSVSVVRGRLATEEDVRAGRAVFFLENADLPGATPLTVPLPALALWRDDESGQERVVIAIQAEQTVKQRLVGFRFLEGGNGIATLDELEWVDLADSRVRAAL
jgi:hypothetical protein